nr:dual specificity protein phosphatase family protein [Lysobacter enzymogenes]
MLDLVAPTPVQLRDAAAAIAQRQERGEVLVCCALGYSRSAAAVAAWLLLSGRAPTVDEAVAILRRARPVIVLREPHLRALRELTAAPASAPVAPGARNA